MTEINGSRERVFSSQELYELFRRANRYVFRREMYQHEELTFDERVAWANFEVEVNAALEEKRKAKCVECGNV